MCWWRAWISSEFATKFGTWEQRDASSRTFPRRVQELSKMASHDGIRRAGAQQSERTHLFRCAPAYEVQPMSVDGVRLLGGMREGEKGGDVREPTRHDTELAAGVAWIYLTRYDIRY